MSEVLLSSCIDSIIELLLESMKILFVLQKDLKLLEVVAWVLLHLLVQSEVVLVHVSLNGYHAEIIKFSQQSLVQKVTLLLRRTLYVVKACCKSKVHVTLLSEVFNVVLHSSDDTLKFSNFFLDPVSPLGCIRQMSLWIRIW